MDKQSNSLQPLKIPVWEYITVLSIIGVGISLIPFVIAINSPVTGVIEGLAGSVLFFRRLLHMMWASLDETHKVYKLDVFVYALGMLICMAMLSIGLFAGVEVYIWKGTG